MDGRRISRRFSGILAPVFTRGAAVQVSFHKVGFGFALCAWLMQLSVFLTPILMKHPEIGFGVCEQLAVLAQVAKPASTAHRATRPAMRDDMPGMDMSDMQHMPDMAMPSSSAPAIASHAQGSDTAVDHAHHRHMFCAFCMVFGHLASFDLVPLMVMLILRLLVQVVMVRIRANAVLLLTFNHHLLPPGRAPPAISLI